MKRFIGLFLTLLGGAAMIWGAISVLTGSSATRITLINDLSVNALTGGLVGVATFTVGLIWMRD